MAAHDPAMLLSPPDLAQCRLMLQVTRLEELRPPVLPTMQASAAYAKAGRDLFIPNTGLAERTNLFDKFLPELGRLTSASLAAGALVLARHALLNDRLLRKCKNKVKDIRDGSPTMARLRFSSKRNKHHRRQDCRSQETRRAAASLPRPLPARPISHNRRTRPVGGWALQTGASGSE
jgi:hypothetical protein